MISRVFRLCICLSMLTVLACGPNNNAKKSNNDNDSTNNQTANNDNAGTNNDNANAGTNSDTNNDPNASTNNDPNASTNNDTNASTNNQTSNTNNTTNNTTNNDTNNNTNNNTVVPQCTDDGEDCVTGEPVNDGFFCVENVCRVECDPNSQFACAVGEACIPVAQGGPFYCQPSDCTGWLDDVSCDAGEKCTAFDADTFLCLDEGAGAEGDACDMAGTCGAGLICAFGECQPLCGADGDCDQAGGERCVGVNDAGVLGDGVGICETGCDSYSFGQCPDGQGCFPVTSEDGVCEDVGDTGRYQACTDPAECGDGTTCITFQEEDAANNIPAVGRCLPFCDASAATQDDRNATCPDSAYCIDLSDDNPTPSSGVCIEQCTDSDAYATGVCSGPSDYCTPQPGRETHLCFPGGPNTVGEACDVEDSTDGCDGTSYCQLQGDGTGLCQPYCQPVTESNVNLGCDTDQTCDQLGDDALNVGRCGYTCTPDADFADTTCPTDLQTCHPPAAGEQAYCSASGSTAIGGACSITTPTCSAGDSCVNDFAYGDLSAQDVFADGTCSESCAIFGDGSDCSGADEVCALNWFTLNTAVGHCTDQDVDANACAQQFDVCGNNSLCLDLGAGVECLELCDLDDDQCDSGTCQQLFQTTDVRVGGCL